MKSLTILLLFVTSLCFAQGDKKPAKKPVAKGDTISKYDLGPNPIYDVSLDPSGNFVYPKAFTDSMKVVRLEYHLRETMKLLQTVSAKKQQLKAAYETIHTDDRDDYNAVLQQLQKPK